MPRLRDRRARPRPTCQTSIVQPARILALAVILAACTRRPSAELHLEDPEAKAEPSSNPSERIDARIEAVCVHSFTVLSNESPSMRSPGIERDFIARCIAGNQIKRSELGEQRWTARAACIELAQTGDQLGLCDGRTPRAEPNPSVEASAATGVDPKALCKRVFELLLAENPDMATIMGPTQLEPILESCTQQVEEERAADPIKFDRTANCMMSAPTVADFEKCEEG
jgi:hypothetical protein